MYDQYEKGCASQSVPILCQRVTMLERTNNQLNEALGEVKRLSELKELLEKNPEFERILSLLR